MIPIYKCREAIPLLWAVSKKWDTKEDKGKSMMHVLYWDTKEDKGKSIMCVLNKYWGMQKDNSWDKETSNCEKIKLVALAVSNLCYHESIGQAGRHPGK